MADITAIRAALAAALANVDGLEVNTRMVSLPNPPAAMIRPESGTFADNDNGGMDRLRFRVHLLVSRADAESGQDLLDEYLATSNVKAAIEADRKLGGTVDRVRVRDWENYGYIAWGPSEHVYLGAELVVEIVTPPN